MTQSLIAKGLRNICLFLLKTKQKLRLRMKRVKKKKLKVEVGISDHSLGIEVPIAAVALGATIVEKHFTLNTKAKGPDHTSSIEPEDLTQMVKSIRNIEKSQKLSFTLAESRCSEEGLGGFLGRVERSLP